MPRYARAKRPSRMSAPMIFRVVSLIGTARPRPSACDGGVDPDDVAAAVGERASGVAGVKRRVRLDDVFDDATCGPRVDRQRAPERRDDAGRHQPGEPVRVPDGDDELASTELLRVAERRRGEVGGVGAENSEVGEVVGADYLRADLASVDEGGIHCAVARGDDVGGGEHEAVGRNDDAASTPDRSSAAPNPPRDTEVGDRRGDSLGDRHDGPGVRVERLLLVHFAGGNERKIDHSGQATGRGQVYREARWQRSDETRRLGADDRAEPAGQAKRVRRGDAQGVRGGAEGGGRRGGPSRRLAGEGRGFCVGQDLAELREGERDVAALLRERWNRHVLGLRSLEKPVLAAVDGAAAGAGLSLACACDLRVAADSAAFVPAFVNVGLVPDTGGSWLIPRLLGYAHAFEWMCSGRKLSADEALAWGLVSEVARRTRF